jgi:hypothetical protein
VANKAAVIVEPRLIGADVARSKVEELLFNGKKPADKFERAARSSFMDCVMELMKDGGKFVSLQ